jgi:hypothetical protein
MILDLQKGITFAESIQDLLGVVDTGAVVKNELPLFLSLGSWFLGKQRLAPGESQPKQHRAAEKRETVKPCVTIRGLRRGSRRVRWERKTSARRSK